MEEYTQRNELLLILGFKDYRAYLRSPLWKSIRQRKIELDPVCYGCGRCDPAIIQVHHGKYTMDNLTGKTLADMYTVCSRCHRMCEVTRSGFKRTPEYATKELQRIRKVFMAGRRVKTDCRVNVIYGIRKPA